MQPRPATILVVEDHRVTRTFLADNLSADGFEPLEAETAGEARRLLAGGSIDLAIIDLGLPDRDGLELLREVRDADRLAGRIDPELPLLVVSGRAAELDRMRGFERGCDDYVIKPFSYAELRGLVVALFWLLSSLLGIGFGSSPTGSLGARLGPFSGCEERETGARLAGRPSSEPPSERQPAPD